jgi:NAD-dependent deacetylase
VEAYQGIEIWHTCPPWYAIGTRFLHRAVPNAPLDLTPRGEATGGWPEAKPTLPFGRPCRPLPEVAAAPPWCEHAPRPRSTMREHFVFLTGAGISADSGVRTFRDAGGLWEGHRPEDVATPEAWNRDPALVWRFYQHRRAQLLEVAPNAAHLALAAFQRRAAAHGHRTTLVTQNVDDLHERAGSAVLHMHGELRNLRCERCGAVVVGLEHLDPDRFLPCALCRHPRLRPDIVWFGEVPYHLDTIEQALGTATTFLAIGTSGNVYPAANMLPVARAAGARTFVQALDAPNNLGTADRFVSGRAAEALPGLLDELLPDGPQGRSH